jgi:anti-anti-sigma regulatory factor
MGIVVETSGDATIIHVNTRLISGEEYFEKFSLISEHVADFESQNIIMDLLKCNYLDTRVIAIILEMHQTLRKLNRTLSLTNVSTDIFDLLKGINLDKIIRIN